jgi:hypothetical protein
MTNPPPENRPKPPTPYELLELVKYRILTVNEARRFLLAPDSRPLLEETERYDMTSLLQGGRHAV